MKTLRSDAARSRERILEAARRLPSGELRLNELARDAGVGVGTVYRHFATVTALLEALHQDALEQLVELARTAARSTPDDAAFIDLVRAGADMQLSHEGLQAVLTAEDVSPEVRALRDDLHRFAAESLDAAIDGGLIRPGMSISAVIRLVCGIEHAVRLGHGDDRALLTEVLISGLRPQRDSPVAAPPQNQDPTQTTPTPNASPSR